MRKPELGPDDRLLLVPVYDRVYVTQVVLGGRFGVDAGPAGRAIRAVGRALAGVFRIPERKVDLGADELAAAFVGATEPPTYRPTRGQKRYDSGKKTRHPLEHRVVVVRKRPRPGRAAAAAGADRGRVGGGPGVRPRHEGARPVPVGTPGGGAGGG